MAEAASNVFLLLSAVITLGFLGYILYERTRVSEVLMLLAFGVLVGPVLHLVPVESFAAAAPFFTTLALAMIMLEGGLELHLQDLVAAAGRSSLLALLGFGLSLGGVAVAAHALLGLGWLESALLGAILGAASSVVVFPLAARLAASDRVRVMLGLDAALGEVLSVVSAITLMEALSLQQANVAHAAQQMAAQFSVAIVLGLVAGVAWARLLTALAGKRYHYMLTMAVVLALHVGVVALGGSGPIAVLVFGVVLGNASTLRRAGLRASDFTPEMRTFQGEITFFLRTFFFVYLGMTASLAQLTGRSFAVASGALTLALLLARLVAARVAILRGGFEPGTTALLATIIPRGLAVAILAALPAAEYGLAFARDFPGYALGVIVLSNLVATLGVLAFGRARSREVSVAEPAPREARSNAAAGILK